MNKPQQNGPDWLKIQEQNSWQIELLISGGMIFTLWQLPEYFGQQLQAAYINTTFSTSLGIAFVGAIMLSRALLIGFGVNLLLRTLWLAFLGIHYAFPKGVNYEKLNYSDYFNERFSQEHNAVSRILKVEKYCSISFSLAIIISAGTVGVLFIGYILYAFVLEKILPLRWYNNEIFGYSITFILGAIAIGLLNRIVFDWLKNKSKLQRWFYPISKVISYLNFTWLFVYESKTLASNIKRWKIHSVTFLYFLLAFLISLNDFGMINLLSLSNNLNPLDKREYKNPLISSQMQNDEYDEHLTGYTLIKEASIPSEIISTSILPLFITYDKYFDKTFNFLYKENDIKTKWQDIDNQGAISANTEKHKKVLDLCFEIKINNKKVKNLNWYYRNHPITQQLGFHTKIDIDTFPRGEHVLDAQFIMHVDSFNSGKNFIRRIPFWKE